MSKFKLHTYDLKLAEIGQGIKQTNELLEEIKEMIDFKIHCDYRNATGNELEAPWDKEAALPLACYEPSEFPCAAFLEMFLAFRCEFEKGAITYAANFNSAVQQLCKEKHLRPYTALEIMEEMERFSQSGQFRLVRENGIKYQGLKLKAKK